MEIEEIEEVEEYGIYSHKYDSKADWSISMSLVGSLTVFTFDIQILPVV